MRCRAKNKKSVEKNGVILISWLVGTALLTACSKGQPNAVLCSGTKSLLRFNSVKAPKTSLQQNYFSNGGFVEVFTRKDVLGPVDSRRLCTAYVEFSNSPLSPAPSNDAPITMSVYSASHCFDASRDHSIKLHLFDGSTYLSYPVESPSLKKVNELRSAMRSKKIPSETQLKVLGAFRASVANIQNLFSSPVELSGNSAVNVARDLCLKTDDLQFQRVCATYHDLSVVQVVPSDRILPSDLQDLREFRSQFSQRLQTWINDTEIAKSSTSGTLSNLVFQDAPNESLTVASLHMEMRKRLQTFSQLKNLQNFASDLLLPLQECDVGNKSPVCTVLPEISAAVRMELQGSGEEYFADSSLLSVVESLGAKYASALNKMDKAFTVLSPYLSQTLEGTAKLGLTTRIHSNLRFVTAKESTVDKPDPLDAMTTGRAFMQMNVNNFTGDNTGSLATFVRWASQTDSPSLGRFAHLMFPKSITIAGAHAGFMQAGDSGALVVIEHIPFFTLTSVDGESTSGGAAIQPLPVPLDEDEGHSDDSRQASGKRNLLCR